MMGLLVFTLAIGIIGFMLGDGMFGENLINAFEWLNTMYMIVLFVVATIVLFIPVWLAITAGEEVGKYGLIAGGALGVLIGAFLVVIPLAQVWITDKITQTINPAATSFGEIGDPFYIYIWAVLVVALSLNKIKIRGLKTSK